jgi:hypothetical protein
MALREWLILRKPRSGCLEELALAKAGDAARPSNHLLRTLRGDRAAVVSEDRVVGV